MDVTFWKIGDAILRTIGFKQLDPWLIQVDNRLNLTDKPTVNVIIIFEVHLITHSQFTMNKDCFNYTLPPARKQPCRMIRCSKMWLELTQNPSLNSVRGGILNSGSNAVASAAAPRLLRTVSRQGVELVSLVWF